MKPRILVVDDHKIMRAMLVNMLGNDRFDFLQAGDGLEALEIMQQDKNISLILSDFSMPNLDGVGLLEEKNKIPEYAKIPFVMVTSSRSEQLQEQSRAIGVSGWLSKPFKKDILEELLNSVLPQTP